MSKNKKESSKTIFLEPLARVEGEGSLYLKIEDDRVSDARLKIFEPPRFFEALLRGRSYTEPPDITARICGICPVAYQMSAVQAIENACGITMDDPTRALRRLIYCGEWIESHALHVFMLHAPDFLGYPDAIAMARDHRELVESGLQLKKTGNGLIRLLGGREIHPVNVRLGGFYRVPEVAELQPIYEQLKKAKATAYNTVLWASKLPFPDFTFEYEYVSMCHPTEYPMNEGRICSNKGLDIGVRAYDDHFKEEQVDHSTALHASLEGKRVYLTGPMARYNLNFDLLTEEARQAVVASGFSPRCLNPFQSIVIRAVETVFACEEAMRLIEDYEKPSQHFKPVPARAGTGYGCTEAPRGLLYHRYTMDEQGTILDARIVPPTSQNQKIIEDDLKRLAQQFITLSKEELTLKCEQAIRNYDPCISCATHFLKLQIDQRRK